MSKNKTYTDKEAAQLMTDIARVIVMARQMQRLAYKVQPYVLGVNEQATSDTSKMIEFTESIIDTSDKLAQKALHAYNAMPDKYKKSPGIPRDLPKSYYLKQKYQNMTDFYGTESDSIDKTYELYHDIISSQLEGIKLSTV